MNKTLQKAVMTRSRLRNKFLKNKTQSKKTAYKKKRNYCVSLFRKKIYTLKTLIIKNFGKL